MAKNIFNLEIFAAGTHRAATGTLAVTENDLDQIVDAFNSLNGSNVVKPHLKLGHTDAQKWFGQKDGIPALGWITKVWREGTKLLADISDVPDALIDMIKSGRYHNVSAEVYWDAPIEHSGRRFARVLSAVSLLGVEMPAVKDLAGLASALFQAGPIHQFAGEPQVKIDTVVKGDTDMPDKAPATETAQAALFSQSQVDALIAAAVEKAVKEAETKFQAKVDSSKTELEVMTKRAETAEADLTKVKAEAAAQEATTLVDQAIKDGKLLPKQRDFALAALAAKDTKLKFGTDGAEKTMPELFKEFLDAQGKVIDTSEKGDGSNKPTTFSTAAEEVDYKVKQFMAEKQPADKQDYGSAMIAVFSADPDLSKRYAEATA